MKVMGNGCKLPRRKNVLHYKFAPYFTSFFFIQMGRKTFPSALAALQTSLYCVNNPEWISQLLKVVKRIIYWNTKHPKYHSSLLLNLK
jgi:hypothetical protein